MNSIRELMKKNQKVVIAVVVALILFSVYNTFFKPAVVDETITGESKEIINSEVGREIINTLNQLKAINIDTDIFDDPLFENLYDFSRPLPKQPVGKTNPFTEQTATQGQIDALNDEEPPAANDGLEEAIQNNTPLAPLAPLVIPIVENPQP